MFQDDEHYSNWFSYPFHQRFPAVRKTFLRWCNWIFLIYFFDTGNNSSSFDCVVSSTYGSDEDNEECFCHLFPIRGQKMIIVGALPFFRGCMGSLSCQPLLLKLDTLGGWYGHFLHTYTVGFFIISIMLIKCGIRSCIRKYILIWSDGLVVKSLDSQSRGPVFKTIGWLQGRLSLSSFRGQ